MRIVWLAAADARGHVMRAHLAKGLLAKEGVKVDIVTTNEEGQRFLAALGTPSELLSSHYGVAFDGWQNMDRARTEACIASYLLRPSRAAKDLLRLDAMCEGAAYVVNDFHPLLLIASPPRCPVVHVHGEHLWHAIEHNFAQRGPALLDKGFSAFARGLRDKAHARIEHTLDASPAGAFDDARRVYTLLPLVAAPERSRAEVRCALGVKPSQKLAAVYLNPHFTDPRLAEAIESSLDEARFSMHAVGEGFAQRPLWRPYDPAFADVAAAADLLISAPGMGAVGLSKLLAVPLLALVTDQPEQRQNLRFLRGSAFEVVDLPSPLGVKAALGGAVRRLGEMPLRDAERAPISIIHRRWAEALTRLAPAPKKRSVSRSFVLSQALSMSR